jgi:hypothetical protein
MKRSLAIKNKKREEENIKILKAFFEKSGAMIDNALKETRRKYPEMFKSS